MMKKFCIYKYTCQTTNKVYIGQTCRSSLKTRAGVNGERYKSCRKFYAAIQKYGWENFKVEILENNLTAEEANIKEKEYIKNYNSIENGYNIFEGGSNKTTSEETKNLQRISQLKKAEENRKIYGTGLKPSAIEKLSKMYKGSPICLKENGASVNAKSVYVYDKDLNFIKEYTSRQQAYISLKISRKKLLKYLDSQNLFNNMFYLKSIKL